MFLFPEKKSFGLDISDLSLRLVQIRKNVKKYTIISYNEMPLPKNVFENGEIKNIEILSESIKKLASTAKGKKIECNHVITVLPEAKTFIKLIRVYADNKESLPFILGQELTKHIPFSIDEIYFDWQVMGVFKPRDENNVLIGAAPIETVNRYIQAIKNSGFIPLALEIESCAITRSLVPMHENLKDDNSGKIIIDMGATRTGLIVYDKNAVQFTISLPVSGNEITQRISEKLKLDYKKAENAKILCGLHEKKCSGALKKILMENVNNLVNKIQEAIYFYEESSGKNNAIKKIILSGGGSQLIGLDTILNEKIGLPATYGNPLTNILKVRASAHFPKNKIQSFTTAIGLALRGSE